MLPPADASAIDFAEAMLANAGAPGVPDEYRAFLLRSDGFTHGGAEFFGTKAANLAAGYKFPGIADMNKGPAGRLRIGSLFVDSAYYVPARGYEIVSDISGETVTPFQTFGGFLEWLCANIR
jgi:hypothetical protein